MTQFKTNSSDELVCFVLWRYHSLQAGCCGTHYPRTTHPHIFLSLSGWRIALSHCTPVACILRLLWRKLLSGFCASFLISRDYFWSVNCTMGCFLWLFQGRFLSSRHSTVGHRLGRYLWESFPSLLGLIWTLLLCHRYSHESTFLHFLLRHRRMNLNQPSKNFKPVTSSVLSFDCL